MMAAGWVPVALSAMIEHGTSAGAQVDGTEMVVWRDTAGVAHVWEDRCPHRGMKLSFGFVRGDHIACLYHGWQFDAAGQCQHIPAHPGLAVPTSICARTWPVAETGGMIWIAMGMADAPPVMAPATGVRSLYLDCDAGHAVALLSDGFGGAARVAGALATIATPGGPVAVGVQPVAPGRCALHITVPGDAASARLIALATQAEALRGMAETGGMAG